MKMLGRCDKPRCGDCCCPYRKGSGKVNKRRLTKTNKRREARDWKNELAA